MVWIGLDPTDTVALENNKHRLLDAIRYLTQATESGELRYHDRQLQEYQVPGLDEPAKKAYYSYTLRSLLDFAKAKQHSLNIKGDGKQVVAAALISGEGVTVSLPHMTKALEAVFKIMWENWKDPDPRRLPKQVNIAREIDQALGWGKQGSPNSEPSRDAKTIAKVIKPDTISNPE